MIAAVVPAPGGPDAFRLEERARVEPAPGEIRIEVAAAGVNRADLLQREGRYPPPPGSPEWPGLEVSGTVHALGDGVDQWRVGDRVCALLGGGGYAEFACAPASLVLPVPDGVTLVEAAGLVEALATVWSNLQAAEAHPGERLLVHGGSGGVGTLAIQLAVALGLDVTTTARGSERAARCRELGAARALDYRTEDFVDAAREVDGFDVVLDVVGAAYLERNVDALAVGGRLVVIGLQGGSHGTLDLGALLRKRARIIGTTLRGRPLGEKADIVSALRELVWPRIPTEIRPIVDSTFPLARVADAHRLVESGQAFGKVVLTVAAD